ncbi:MAG TPA: GntR family transcriptional regulator [Alcaligenaceae bacterium]|nr:GntR family transcriptional regulator [Alcaligenaceae bacterium]
MNNYALSNNDSPLPLYHRLYVILKESILNGTYQPGTLLPSETELTQAYGVSRITAKRALNELADEDLVERKRGKGTFVKKRKSTELLHTPIQANIQALMSNLTVIDLETSVEVKQFEYKKAGLWVSQQLQIPLNSTIQRAVRVRYYKDTPFSISTSHVLKEIGTTYTEEDLEKTALIHLIQKAGHNILHVHQTITCTLANEETAPLLKVSVGSPLLKLRRIFINTNKKPVNYAEMLYSPERFEYNMNLTLESP